MIKIESNKLSVNELKEIHKLLCAFHKVDYSLYIDSKDNNIIATMEEI